VVEDQRPRRALSAGRWPCRDGRAADKLIVDTRLEGWLDASRPDGADIYLPASLPGD